jgi:large subunit ribosomal protein L31e
VKDESDEEEEKTEEEQADLAETAEEEEVEEKGEEVLGKEEEKEEEKVEEAVEAEAEETPAPVEEEAKPPPREEKVKEEEIVEEKIYTIPLSKAWIMPANKRAPRAMRMIRSFVNKHMKLEVRRGEEEEEGEEPKRLVVSNEVNERVWGRGIEKPPRKIRVRAAKDKEGNVTVYLAEGD